MSILLKVT